MPYTDRVIASTPPSDERSLAFLGPAGRARAQQALPNCTDGSDRG
jgi:hypothetical protein